MNRREMLAGVGILSTLFMSEISFGDKKNSETSALSKEKLKKATDAAFDCIKKGEACLSHCIDMIRAGDTSMKNCYGTLQNMMASCTALSKIGSYDTSKPE